MLGSVTFDLVLGMVFLYLSLSLAVSAVREAIEARLKTRSKLLAHGIVQMLGDVNAGKLYQHPLIQALYDGGKYEPKAAAFNGHQFFSWLFMLPASIFHQTKMPAYIPARPFALALLNMAATNELWDGEVQVIEPIVPPVTPPATWTLIDRARAALQGRTDELSKALLAALSIAGSDVDKGVEAIQKWYDAAMDRVSGWYKRESQHILFWLGLVVAVSMNVDSIFLTKYLAGNTEARQNLAMRAEIATKDTHLTTLVDSERTARIGTSKPTDDDLGRQIKAADVKVADAIRSVTDLNLPIGWTRMRWNDFMDWSDPGFKNLWTLLGWLLTAFGLSFGAPFWFDMLNQIMVVRSTVKPHEKSPEESPEVKQTKAT